MLMYKVLKYSVDSVQRPRLIEVNKSSQSHAFIDGAEVNGLMEQLLVHQMDKMEFYIKEEPK